MKKQRRGRNTFVLQDGRKSKDRQTTLFEKFSSQTFIKSS